LHAEGQPVFRQGTPHHAGDDAGDFGALIEDAEKRIRINIDDPQAAQSEEDRSYQWADEPLRQYQGLPFSFIERSGE
jgi:hypothetical protein